MSEFGWKDFRKRSSDLDWLRESPFGGGEPLYRSMAKVWGWCSLGAVIVALGVTVHVLF